MALLACEIPFLATTKYARCQATGGAQVIATINDLPAGFYLPVCNTDFEYLSATWVYCRSENVQSITDISTLTSSTTLKTAQLDSFEDWYGYIKYPVNFQPLAVSSLIEVPPTPGIPTSIELKVPQLSNAEYSSLLSMAVVSLTLAFTLNYVYRFIVNRN